MLLSSIVSTQNVDPESTFSMISELVGAVFGRRFVILKTGGEFLVLPVTPSKYQVTTAQQNKTYDILDFGEALVFGNAKLKRLKFSGFFPSLDHGYPFIVGMRTKPKACVDLITKWKEAKSPVRVIITDSPVNHMMAIMDFNYEERDGTRDIYYKLSFTEYKDLNTPPANNDKKIDILTNLRERPEEASVWDEPARMVKNSEDSIDLYKRSTGGCEGFNDFRESNSDYDLDSNDFNRSILGV